MAVKEDMDITAAEWEVMRVMWTQEETTSKEVSDTLTTNKGWKPATSKTLIGRLKDKGLVRAEQDGRRYLYSPIISEPASVQQNISSLFDRVCNKKAGQYLNNFIEEKELSQSDIDQLIETLQNKKEDAPVKVACQCPPGQCQC